MVKAVVGDEPQLKLAENRLTDCGLPSQVGLVVGKLSPKLDKGFVYDLVPTPPNDAGDPPCSVVGGTGENERNKKKNSSKSKSQPEASALSIDIDWVSEHARQVSRMLLGGMKVIGIYIWVNEISFKNSITTLCQTVKGVAAAASSITTDQNERLLIHISYSPLRWTCRNCSLADNVASSSLRPCDFKMGKVLGSLQTFRCTYTFDVRMPIDHENGLGARRFVDVLRDGIMIHAKELAGAKALINGKVVTEDELCASEGFHEVEFLLPLLQDKYTECNGKEVLGVLLFGGTVCSLAYLNSKEPISQALIDIKEDIIKSLESRLDIMCDEADRELDPDTNDIQETDNRASTDKFVPNLNLQVQRKHCNLSFPRRVLVPWLEGTYICDYVQRSETVEALKDHCIEIMSIEVPTDASEILEPESESPFVETSSTISFWSIASGSPSAKPDNSLAKNIRDKANEKSGESADYTMVKLSLLILIVSIILGLAVNALRVS
ncbi:uncharacterized protein [Henckelia pumila]|uniref:uncharacterized protein n=1 Tax=Henckelia pumila TaxID=405737 RepID=UPI003C6E5570